jgi:hypothetical protein
VLQLLLAKLAELLMRSALPKGGHLLKPKALVGHTVRLKARRKGSCLRQWCCCQSQWREALVLKFNRKEGTHTLQWLDGRGAEPRFGDLPDSAAAAGGGGGGGDDSAPGPAPPAPAPAPAPGSGSGERTTLDPEQGEAGSGAPALGPPAVAAPAGASERVTLQGRVYFALQQRNRLEDLMAYDVSMFVLIAGGLTGLVFYGASTGGITQEWEVRGVLFWARVLFALSSIPYLLFSLPGVAR